MKWQTIVEGIIIGLSASVVIAAAVIFKERIRDFFLNRRIKKSCERLSVGSGIRGAHVGISNQTGTTLIIRGVFLMTESTNLVLSVSSEIQSCAPKQRDAKLTKEQKRKIKAGEKVLISQDLSFGTSWQEQNLSEGFAELHPYTSRTWLLHPEINPKPDTQIRAVGIEIEYLSFSGTTEVISIVTENNIDILKRYIDGLDSQLKDGSFNHGRKLFGLPPIKGFPTKKKEAQPVATGQRR